MWNVKNRSSDPFQKNDVASLFRILSVQVEQLRCLAETDCICISSSSNACQRRRRTKWEKPETCKQDGRFSTMVSSFSTWRCCFPMISVVTMDELNSALTQWIELNAALDREKESFRQSKWCAMWWFTQACSRDVLLPLFFAAILRRVHSSAGHHSEVRSGEGHDCGPWRNCIVTDWRACEKNEEKLCTLSTNSASCILVFFATMVVRCQRMHQLL